MSTINIKRGDTKAKFIDVLTLNSVAVDLTGCSLKFIMRRHGKPSKVVDEDGTITNLPGTDGAVEYQPVADDIDQEGVYDQNWKVTFPSGKILTFPNNGFNTVNIFRDIPEPA